MSTDVSEGGSQTVMNRIELTGPSAQIITNVKQAGVPRGGVVEVLGRNGESLRLSRNSTPAPGQISLPAWRASRVSSDRQQVPCPRPPDS